MTACACAIVRRSVALAWLDVAPAVARILPR